MHARVAAFENRNTSRIDDLIKAVRDRSATEAEPVPGALAMLMLVDRSAGRMLGVSLFENEQAIAAAEPTFEQMGDEIPEELRGRRISVDRFEVAIHEVAEEATAARLSTLDGSPGVVDELVHYAESTILPEARELEGWKGVIALVNRSTGECKLITLWESQQALRASEEAANDLRRRSADHVGDTIVDVQRYEVPMMYDRAPKLVAH
jgi:hypothetical protein